jgi:hypothetical protein
MRLVPGSLSLEVKRPGREADHSPPSSAEVKELVELYLHSPNTPSWRGALLGGAQGQLYLLFVISGYRSNKVSDVVISEIASSSVTYTYAPRRKRDMGRSYSRWKDHFNF